MKFLIYCFFILTLCISTLFGQNTNYLIIDFNGKDTLPDSVYVENITQGTSLSMSGTDILHLVIKENAIAEATQENPSCLSIYPNPMESFCHFEFNTFEEGNIMIRLYHISGKVIHKYNSKLSAGKHVFQLSGISAGLYIISVETSTHSLNGKFVVVSDSKTAFSFKHTEETRFEADNKKPKLKNNNETLQEIKMDYVIGDQLMFIGYADDCLNDTLYGSPSNNTTYTFDFIKYILSITTDKIIQITSDTTAISNTEIICNDPGSIIARGVCWSISPNPSIEDEHTVDGTGTGNFNSILIGLSKGTTYYLRAYVTNIKGTYYGYPVIFTQLVIGMTYQGGIVAYIYNMDDPGYIYGQGHGIIAAPMDISSGIQWGCYGTLINGTSTALVSGKTNTEAIINGCTGSNAAYICDTFSLNGYNDWYLPSKDELNKLYLSKTIIGGFENNTYWSSSEKDAGFAWMQYFYSGNADVSYKNSIYMGVRAVRAF